MKKFLALLLTAVMMFSMSIVAFAAVPDTDVVSPLWDNVYSATNAISFNGTAGKAESVITGKTGTTKITGTIAVYKLIDEETDKWDFVGYKGDTTTTSRGLNLSCTFTGESGAYYKSVLNVTVTTNGVAENIITFSYNTCP